MSSLRGPGNGTEGHFGPEFGEAMRDLRSEVVDAAKIRLAGEATDKQARNDDVAFIKTKNLNRRPYYRILIAETEEGVFTDVIEHVDIFLPSDPNAINVDHPQLHSTDHHLIYRTNHGEQRGEFYRVDANGLYMGEVTQGKVGDISFTPITNEEHEESELIKLLIRLSPDTEAAYHLRPVRTRTEVEALRELFEGDDN